MKVRILATPKEIQRGKPVNPFTNPYEDSQTPEMAYGGPLPSTGKPGNNARIDTYWDWMRDNSLDKNKELQPFASVGKILPEAKNGTGNINAEKQEQVMGDFVGDGMPVLMNVAGKPHTQGGKDIKVPDNSFVFSDTKALTIKDPAILARFGETKPKTPAQIAKKYDLQKYKAIIDDDRSEAVDKQTARLMYANYTAKLNELAGIQEGMKEAKGIGDNQQPQEQQPISRYGGYQRMESGGKYDWQKPWELTEDEGNPPIPQVKMTDYDHELDGVTVTPPNFGDPNFMNKLALNLNQLTYPKTMSQRQIDVPHYQQFIASDNRAELQALQSMAASLGANSGEGVIGRANKAAAQGRLADPINKSFADMYNRNLGEAARIGQANAQEATRSQMQKNLYDKDYLADVNNAAKDTWAKSADYFRQVGAQSAKEKQQAIDAYNYNFINPYYTMDSRGILQPKSAEQSKALLATINQRNGVGAGESDKEEQAAAYYKKLLSIYGEDKNGHLMNAARNRYGLGERASVNIDPMTGLRTKERVTGLPYGQEFEFGGKILKNAHKKTKMKIVAVPH